MSLTLKLLEKARWPRPGLGKHRSPGPNVPLPWKYPTASELLKTATHIPDTEKVPFEKARVELGQLRPMPSPAAEHSGLGTKAALALLSAKPIKTGLREEARQEIRRRYRHRRALSIRNSKPAHGAVPAPTAQQRRQHNANPSRLLHRGQTSSTKSTKLLVAVPVSPLRLADALDALRSPMRHRSARSSLSMTIGGMEDVIERIRMNIIYPF